MLYKSLIMGVLFSIGIFAVKSGMGISYALLQQKLKRGKAVGFFLFAMVYGLVFGSVALILSHIDPVRHLTVIQTFIQSGMIVHLVMTGLMVLWGVVLLKRNNSFESKSRGWLILAVPCPVCVTIILLSSAFLISCFPNYLMMVMFMLYLAFMLISLITLFVMHQFQKVSIVPAESFLGAAMLIIAAYFLISVTVMPQFADLDKVYRLAMYHPDIQSQNRLHRIYFIIFSIAAFGAGYGITTKKIRSIT